MNLTNPHMVLLTLLTGISICAPLQTVAAYEMDVFYRGKWVGDTSTKIEKSAHGGKPAIKSTRKTQITVSMGRVKPMFNEVVAMHTEAGEPIDLRYTFSSGLEAQQMRVFWEPDQIVVERSGLNGSGSLEPQREIVSRKKAQVVGGSPLDSILLGAAGKKSSVTLSMNFDSKTWEEDRIEYIGEARLFAGNTRQSALEFHVIRGKAILYKVFVEPATNVPLRIESIDGMLMLPKKRP